MTNDFHLNSENKIKVSLEKRPIVRLGFLVILYQPILAYFLFSSSTDGPKDYWQKVRVRQFGLKGTLIVGSKIY